MDKERDALRLLEAELAAKEADVAQLRRLVEQLRERAVGPSSVEGRGMYANVGVTEAVRQLLREAGEPQSTRDICSALLDRGIRSRAKNFPASVYATLKNNSKEFERVGGSAWRLKEVNAKTESGLG